MAAVGLTASPEAQEAPTGGGVGFAPPFPHAAPLRSLYEAVMGRPPGRLVGALVWQPAGRGVEKGGRTG